MRNYFRRLYTFTIHGLIFLPVSANKFRTVTPQQFALICSRNCDKFQNLSQHDIFCKWQM